MNLGYARISKANGTQVLDLQVDALKEAGVDERHIYQDQVSGKQEQRPGLEALRAGDTLLG